MFKIMKKHICNSKIPILLSYGFKEVNQGEIYEINIGKWKSIYVYSEDRILNGYYYDEKLLYRLIKDEIIEFDDELQI